MMALMFDVVGQYFESEEAGDIEDHQMDFGQASKLVKLSYSCLTAFFPVPGGQTILDFLKQR